MPTWATTSKWADMRKSWLIVLLLALPALAYAKMYKVVHEDGSVTFTDIPPSLDAKAYQPKGINAINNPAYNTKALRMVIPYVDKGGSMIVQGSINGVAMAFIVDTGATLLAIPPVVAKKAGLYDQPSTAVNAQTANGEVRVPKVRIAQVAVANIKQRDVEATIQQISTTDTALGLLGMSFFKHYNIHIDHQKREIRLEPK